MVKISETKEGTVHKGRPTYRMEKGSDKMCTDMEKKDKYSLWTSVLCIYSCSYKLIFKLLPDTYRVIFTGFMLHCNNSS